MVESSESTETRSRWACREWRWQMIQWCFYSPFHISSALWLLQKWSSFALRACSSPVVNFSPRPLQTFVQLEQCASYRGSTWILSRRQYVPSKQHTLNNNVRLITRFYGTNFQTSQKCPLFSYFNVSRSELQYRWSCTAGNGQQLLWLSWEAASNLHHQSWPKSTCIHCAIGGGKIRECFLPQKFSATVGPVSIV